MARFVAALRARGVSVLFPYLAWDTGTCREGVRDEEAVVVCRETVFNNFTF